MGWIVRLAFARLWWLLPVRRVSETAGVLAFEHPAPTWQPHILLVPKHAIRSLAAAQPADARPVGEIVRLALAVVARRQLDADGCVLLVNGGAYQDVPQLHFHLAGLDDGLRYATPDAVSGPVLAQTATLAAYSHPTPRRDVHIVIQPGMSSGRLAWRDLAGPAGELVGTELVTVAQALIERLQLGAAGHAPGYTLLASVPPGGLDRPVCFHLVAGEQRPDAAAAR